MPGKISELAVLASPDAADQIEVLDVSDLSMGAGGTNKRSPVSAFGGGGSTVRSIVTHTGTAVTGALGDAGAYLRFTGTNPTYTIPPNSSVAFPVGTQIDGVGTATAMTLVAGSGVTLNKARTLVTVGADSGWTIIKVAADGWDVHGAFV